MTFTTCSSAILERLRLQHNHLSHPIYTQIAHHGSILKDLGLFSYKDVSLMIPDGSVTRH